MAEWLEQELQKLKVLFDEGVVQEESYMKRVDYLREHGITPQAGVGMVITERAPFKVLQLAPGGPAERTGKIKVGDVLQLVDGIEVAAQGFSGEQVRAAIIGPVGSAVELQFQEVPARSQHGAFRIKVKRADPNQGGITQVGPMASPGGSTKSVLGSVNYNDDFDMSKAEKALKSQYDPIKKEWARTLIFIVAQEKAFAEGAMRKAYRMKDLSAIGDDSQYVLKISKDPNEDTAIYFDDVKMQMEAKMYADMFNAKNPPKKVDFLSAYVVQLLDRPGEPVCAVEKYIEGEYKKYNNNWDWSDDKRNTPQAFTHFTYYASNRELLVCDIQGVGDNWTDPQVHSANGEGYGKGNLGQKGIDRFLQSHACNPICQWLKLPPTGRVKSGGDASQTVAQGAPAATVIRGANEAMNSAPPARPPPDPHAARAQQELERAKQEMEALRREKEEIARMKAELDAARQSSGASKSDVDRLMEMGFARNLAAKAIESTQTFEEAAEWCLTNGELDHSPPRQNHRPAAAGRSSSRTLEKGRLLKEKQEMDRNMKVDGEVVFASPRGDEGEDLLRWDAFVFGPPGSPYENGVFTLELLFSDSYPLEPPEVKFKTKIFHPNIWARPDDRFGEVCLDILADKWSPALRVHKLLLSVVALLQDPNADSAIDKFIGQALKEKPAQFSQMARTQTSQYALQFKASELQQLLEMSLPLTKCVKALKKSKGDVNQAVEAIFTGTIDEEEPISDWVGFADANEQDDNGQRGRPVNTGGRQGAPPAYEAPASSTAQQNNAQQNVNNAAGGRVNQGLPSYDQAVRVPQQPGSAGRPSNDQLPPGWQKFYDMNTRKHYYHNPALNKTQWEHPGAGYSQADFQF